VVAVTAGPLSAGVSSTLRRRPVAGRRVCGGFAGAFTSTWGSGNCAQATCGHAIAPSDSTDARIPPRNNREMPTTRHAPAICPTHLRANASFIATQSELITTDLRPPLRENFARFEAAVKQKEAAGFVVFTEIDHAAAAKKFGIEMRPRTVIVFGNPKLGTPAMVKMPLLAIDVPYKALVWEDDQGKV
jgi:hypothetical protein